MGQAYPVAGWTFVTNERRPILEFVEDTSPGRHDCLAAACDQWRYEQLGAGPEHGSCEQNLLAEAQKHGLESPTLPSRSTCSPTSASTDDGRFDLEPCVTKPGDTATFRMLMDGIVVLSACPQDIVGFQPGGPTDMAIEILDEAPGGVS